MAQYKGKTVSVDAPATAIAQKFEDLTVLQSYVDKLPEDQRTKLGDVRFEHDAIVIKHPTVGEMAFRVVERSDRKISFKADGLLPFVMNIELDPIDGGTRTNVTTELDVEIPAMLRPLIGGKLQQVADVFGDFIAKLVNA